MNSILTTLSTLAMTVGIMLCYPLYVLTFTLVFLRTEEDETVEE